MARSRRPGRTSRLELALSRVENPAALGPAVPLASAARSLRGARETLALGVRGALGPGPWRWDDHLAAIGLAQAAEPLSELADRLIAPLRAESDGSRLRLLATLEAVLRRRQPRHGGARTRHPRADRPLPLGRLRELLGPLLDDPKRRFELHVALRARRLAVGPAAETFRDRRR